MKRSCVALLLTICGCAHHGASPSVPPAAVLPKAAPPQEVKKSGAEGPVTWVRFSNATSEPVRIVWWSATGERIPKHELQPLQTITERTWEHHLFEIESMDGHPIGLVPALAHPRRVVIGAWGVADAESAPEVLQALNAARLNGYELRSMGPFTVYVSRYALTHPETVDALVVLEQKLLDAVRRLGPRYAELWPKTSVFVEWATLTDNSARTVPHPPDKLLLLDDDPRKSEAVEIGNVKNFLAQAHGNQPLVVLHELAHVIFSRALYEDPRVDWAYQRARELGVYDNSSHGMANSDEHFAQLSESWFGMGTSAVPWAALLKQKDPIGASLMEQVYGPAVEPAELSTTACRDSPRSPSGADRTVVILRNAGASTVHVAWVTTDGVRRPQQDIAPGKEGALRTFAGHVFVATTDSGACVELAAEPEPHLAVITLQ